MHHAGDVKSGIRIYHSPLLANQSENRAWTWNKRIYLIISPSEVTTATARSTVYPKKYAHGYCFAVLCCGYTLTDFPISIRLTSLALWQSNVCPNASKATLMNMDKYFMWIHYERLHNHNKAKHNKTVCICLGIYCTSTCHCQASDWQLSTARTHGPGPNSATNSWKFGIWPQIGRKPA